MAGLTIGGFYIKSYEGTRSHGPEPASAGGVGVLNFGGSPSIGAGDYVALSIMGSVFFGIVSTMDRLRSLEDGDEYAFQMVDNRIRLRWALVFGRWNMQEDAWRCHSDPVPNRKGELDDWTLFDDVEFGESVDFTAGDGSVVRIPVAPDMSPGSPSRGKMYSHIPPGMWSSQQQVYSSAPRTAAQIIEEAVISCVGNSALSLSFHSSQQKPVFSVDANSGMSLSAFLQQMADAQGLQMTMDGSNTLRFTRRGQGTVVIPDRAHYRRAGASISNEPTKVRVVGGRRLVQVNEVPLVPDWNRAWESFMAEPAWLEEVKLLASNAGPSPENAADRAEVAAWAREITLAQYVALKGVGAATPKAVELLETEFLDNGRYGRVSRMDMPVWTYLNQIVFRSYRIDSEATLYGLPMHSLEIHDQLLCAVTTEEADSQTRTVYRSTPLEFYPQSSAFVIAKGQPLDMSCAEQTDAIIRQRNKDTRDVWSEISNFEVDADQHSIRFSTPVFIDGLRSEGKSILLYPNRGDGGSEDLSEDLDDGDSYLDIVKPNPDFEIEPAEVRATLVFRLGMFHRDFGHGARMTVHQVDSIAEHLLHGASGFSPSGTAAFTGNLGVPSPPTEGFLEILMEDGQSAVQAAADQAVGLTVLSGIEESGEYTRYGVAGATLNGAIDRITVTLTTQGLTETVEFAKPRPSRGFRSTREIADRLRNEELFDGQKALQREVSDLRAIASLMRLSPTSDRPRASTHASMPDVFRKPIGAPDEAVMTLPDPNNQWPANRTESNGNSANGWRAGDLVWLNDAGVPDRTGKLFGGVCVMDSSNSYVSVCKNGTAPVAVAPGTAPGVLFANPGDWKASATGSVVVGTLHHASAVPGTGEATLSACRLGVGGGGGGAQKIAPLTLVSTRPSYIPVGAAVPENHATVWITWGMVRNRLPTNWSNRLDVLKSGTYTKYLFMKVDLVSSGSVLEVASCTWETWNSSDEKTNPAWGANGERPAFLYVPLGTVQVESGVVHLHSSGGGDINVMEYLSEVVQNGVAGFHYRKALTYSRMNY